MRSLPVCRGLLPTAPRSSVQALSLSPAFVTVLLRGEDGFVAHMASLNPLLCFRARGHLLPGGSTDPGSPRGACSPVRREGGTPRGLRKALCLHHLTGSC